MIEDGFKVSRGYPLFAIVSTFYVPIAAFVWATIESIPFIEKAYEAKFDVLTDRGSWYLAIALYVFSISWWPLELRRARGVMKDEAHRRAFYLCCRAISACLAAKNRETSILRLDVHVQRFGRALVSFGQAEYRLNGSWRQAAYCEHAVRVRSALDEVVARLMREGSAALPEVAAMLVKIMERLANERFLGLLDEAQLPAYVAPIDDEVEAESRRSDGRIVLWGAAAAAVVAGVMISAGVPVAAVVPAALIFLLGPATLWGSKRLGSPRDMLDAVRQGVSQPADPQQADNVPTVAPSGMENQNANIPTTRAQSSA
ncbi:hypothetical protein ACFW64_25875 [Streptomyces albidoflavus]